MAEIDSKLKEATIAGKEYLLSKAEHGLFREFHQLAHGASEAWTSACVGSSLREFGEVPEEILEILLSQQSKEGGWSYNSLVPSDTDSTLRVMQFLQKNDFQDHSVLKKAERFVLSHQQPDGGIATYLPSDLEKMGYGAAKGWMSSHPCVTALAVNILPESETTKKARRFLKSQGLNAYWWRTPRYVGYELGQKAVAPIDDADVVDLSLHLLTQSKLGKANKTGALKLLKLQRPNGSFESTKQFRIPRPDKNLTDLTGEEEIIEDQRGILSTCAAIVALERQRKLLAA